jgi:glucose-1-phosphate cytidylyltransferase
MKVVLFCGGMGLRLRDDSQTTPKPLAEIGNRPIIWHLMKYYAHYGHTDFILCLGYRAEAFKDYFLNYNETHSNDFVLSDGGRHVELARSDIEDWTIRFVDTGLHANIGMRLKAVEKHLEGEKVFLANYSDGLSDLPLDTYLENFERKGKLASFVSVANKSAAHAVEAESDGTVTGVRALSNADIRINGGFFAFRNEIFDYIEPGDELVLEPFERLIKERELVAYRYDGFWQCMDTFKEKQMLEEMASREDMPWQPWKKDEDSND